ncbi:unnamed protein product [Coffea canephora]|uniref:Uncharacterized protein n=1 Tax=Coffea canephora TaxID=49390 RepID=A0A068V3M3_COFCA|nr:unnamed protein product [Coffea canephora]
MIMFSTFEHSVDLICQNIVQKRNEEQFDNLSPVWILANAAGAVRTMISNPVDLFIMSSLDNRKAETVVLFGSQNHTGFVNLFTRSLLVRMTIVGRVVSLQWFFYVSIKVLSGL